MQTRVQFQHVFTFHISHFIRKYFSQSQNLSCHYTLSLSRGPSSLQTTFSSTPGPLTWINIHKSTKGPLLSMGDPARQILEICIVQRHQNHPLCLSFLEIILKSSSKIKKRSGGLLLLSCMGLYGSRCPSHEYTLLSWVNWNCDFSQWMRFDFACQTAYNFSHFLCYLSYSLDYVIIYFSRTGLHLWNVCFQPILFQFYNFPVLYGNIWPFLWWF